MTADAYPALGFDPAPGDPDAVRQLADTLRTIARDGGHAHGQLARVGAPDGIWTGRSADAFTGHFSAVRPYLRRAVDALDTVSRALDGWEGQLRDFQSRAAALEAEAVEARRQCDTAHAGLTALPAGSGHDADRTARQRAYDQAASTVADVRQRALTLNGGYTAAAADVAHLVARAADDAPPQPGFWDGVLDFLHHVGTFLSDPEVWKLIGDIFSDASLILGVVCLVLLLLCVPGPGWLALLGLGLAAGALLFHGVAMAMGAKDVTWTTIGFDLAGTLLAGIGVAGSIIADAGADALRIAQDIRAAGGIVNWFRAIGPTLTGWTLVASGNIIGGVSTIAGDIVSGIFTGDGLRDAHPVTWKNIPLVGPIGQLLMEAGKDFGTPRQPQPVQPGKTLHSAGNAFLANLRPVPAGAPA